MLQVTQNYKSGKLSLEQVPVPALKKGGIVVRTCYSLVSSGTEAASVRRASLNLIEKAKARPDQVKKVLHSLHTQGLLATYRTVMNRLDSLTPLGYSLSGIVAEVGDGVEEFKQGQRVACGGVGYANHAEYNFIPKNLLVPIPDEVTMPQAACTTIGTVAMQGFRQSSLSVGDTVVVIGLGLVGQLYLQIAKAAGCRTMGIDINEEKLRLARESGADDVCTPDLNTAVDKIKKLSGGIGADAVALVVGTDSNEPLFLAIQLLRDRGRLVNIGKAKLDIPYDDFFKKDLTLVFSRSYGPGRYDPVYEEKGIDYPPGYVKWTQRRNMSAFLDLVAKKKIDLTAIIKTPVPFGNAEQAYKMLLEDKYGLGILFKYSDSSDVIKPAQRIISIRPSVQNTPLVLGCIGAGNYSCSKLLPLLAKDRRVGLKAVVTTKGTTAKTVAMRFGFERAGTDPSLILEDNLINTVVIATPHDSHAEFISKALKAGKTVFAEKPLAINPQQLDVIKAAVEECGNDRLQIGFNRRFAPLSLQIKEAFRQISPLHILIRVNAGRIDPKSWISDPQISGGRFIGEGCHFVDLASFWVGNNPVDAYAAKIAADNDNISVLLTYPDGSVANILYATSGSALASKEHIEIYGGGRTAILDDFKQLTICGDKKSGTRLFWQDKGQKRQMEAFCNSALNGKPMPIPLACLFATTTATFKVMESLSANSPCSIG